MRPGSLAEHRDYTAYGEMSRFDDTGTELPDTTALDFVFGFNGREWDDDVDLANHRARWYDPHAARFINQDPSGFAGGDANLYRYAGNNPVLFVDPSGLCYQGFVNGFSNAVSRTATEALDVARGAIAGGLNGLLDATAVELARRGLDSPLRPGFSADYYYGKAFAVAGFADSDGAVFPAFRGIHEWGYPIVRMIDRHAETMRAEAMADYSDYVRNVDDANRFYQQAVDHYNVGPYPTRAQPVTLAGLAVRAASMSATVNSTLARFLPSDPASDLVGGLPGGGFVSSLATTFSPDPNTRLRGVMLQAAEMARNMAQIGRNSIAVGHSTPNTLYQMGAYPIAEETGVINASYVYDNTNPVTGQRAGKLETCVRTVLGSVQLASTGLSASGSVVGRFGPTAAPSRVGGSAVQSSPLSMASGTGQTSRILANPSAGTLWRGVRARARLGSRFQSLYEAAQRNVGRAREAQLRDLQSVVGYQGRVRYLHEAGSSTYAPATGEIIIRQHAFYEPGGLKSTFLHEVGHSELPIWATEYMVDMRAASIAERVFGHSNDIILPFTD